MHLNVGEVPTPFHMLKVKVTTEKDRMERVDKAILKEDPSLASAQGWHFLEVKMEVRKLERICVLMLEGIYAMRNLCIVLRHGLGHSDTVRVAHL